MKNNPETGVSRWNGKWLDGHLSKEAVKFDTEVLWEGGFTVFPQRRETIQSSHPSVGIAAAGGEHHGISVPGKLTFVDEFPHSGSGKVFCRVPRERHDK